MSPGKIVVDKLLKDLRDRPEDFSADGVVLNDKGTGYRYFLGRFPRMYAPYNMGFGLIQSYRLGRGIELWKARKHYLTSENLEKESDGG